MITIEEIKPFNEQTGTPAIEAAKKRGRKKKEAKPQLKMFYTLRNEKIVKVIVKKNGAYTEFVGTKKKMGSEFNNVINKWKKEGLWIEPHQEQEFVKELIESIKE